MSESLFGSNCSVPEVCFLSTSTDWFTYNHTGHITFWLLHETWFLSIECINTDMKYESGKIDVFTTILKWMPYVMHKCRIAL